MAERRMFARTIVASDAFLDMPLSARCLYFALGMFADDEGFINNVNSIVRLIGASADDKSILLVRRFIIEFPSGVCLIKHWRINNYLRSDRFQATKYTEERNQVAIGENGAYVLIDERYTNGIPNNGIPSIGKVSIVEDSREEVKEDIVSMYVGTKESACAHVKSYEEIMNDCCVEEEVRPMLWEFIKHCQANGHKLINSKLTNIILALDYAYGNSYKEKIASLKKAINGGYFDVVENNRQLNV